MQAMIFSSVIQKLALRLSERIITLTFVCNILKKQWGEQAFTTCHQMLACRKKNVTVPPTHHRAEQESKTSNWGWGKERATGHWQWQSSHIYILPALQLGNLPARKESLWTTLTQSLLKHSGMGRRNKVSQTAGFLAPQLHVCRSKKRQAWTNCYIKSCSFAKHTFLTWSLAASYEIHTSACA